MPPSDACSDRPAPATVRTSVWRNVIVNAPALLIALRIILAPLLFVWIVQHHLKMAAAVYVVAVLSDICDGVIARRLGIATLGLRLADGYADIWFFVCLGGGFLISFRGSLGPLATPFFTALSLQAVSWIFCLWRFRRMSSYHSLLAKLTGLCLCASILGFLLAATPAPLGWALWLYAAAITEEIAMTAILPRYHHDVWTLVKALHVRRADLAAVVAARSHAPKP